MSYKLDLTEQAKKDLTEHIKSGNKAIVKKITVLLEELTEHPYTGTGKPEPLKYNLTGYWSRRINQEHRLIYMVIEESIVVLVVSAQGHYAK